MTEHQGGCSGGNETNIGGKRAKLLTCSVMERADRARDLSDK